MKRLAILLFTFCSLQSQAQRQLEKIWETDTTLAVPESVLPDIKNGILYVSLIDGGPWDVDGKGGIAKVDLNGKITNSYWVKGLNAPKGMGMHANKLYVADVTEVAVIDIAKGTIDQKIPVPEAQGLNDVSIDKNGVVYVSDSKLGNVHRIEKGKVSTYLTGLKGLNGVRAVDNELYVATGKDVYRTDASKKLTSIGVIDQGGDGIEPVGNGDWIGSAWAGYIYYFHKDGKRDLLLDSHEQKMNTADFGYDPAKKIMYVPTFFRKSVVAYQVK
jgi:hypothetical protein